MRLRMHNGEDCEQTITITIMIRITIHYEKGSLPRFVFLIVIVILIVIVFFFLSRKDTEPCSAFFLVSCSLYSDSP